MDQTPPNLNLPTDTRQQSDLAQPKSRNRKPIIIIVLIFIAVTIAGTFFINRSSKPDTDTLKVTREATVSITSNGFEPATLQIPVGTQVTWTNNDKLNHQITPNPTNKSKLPDFNGELVLLPNDTYSFNFTETGTYGFYDQKNPVKFQGEIIVK